MKISVTFKTPDAVDDSITEAARDGEHGDTEEARMEARLEAEKAVAKFVRYGEYVTIVFDTEAGTAEVQPV